MHDDLVSAPYTGNHTIFLSGPPGSGKTTLAVRRLRYLLSEGIPGEQILILVPQRTLATPYYRVLLSIDSPAGEMVDASLFHRQKLELIHSGHGPELRR